MQLQLNRLMDELVEHSWLDNLSRAAQEAD